MGAVVHNLVSGESPAVRPDRGGDEDSAVPLDAKADGGANLGPDGIPTVLFDKPRGYPSDIQIMRDWG